ncbi:hypothetical protein ACMXYR_14435 [Neptuniibacter sp. QD29_5]|uniref:hypothetical protein n=1 Tax=Neptuniibacter sp. QD29_5 TaxID=3398207 RepID=UPI0039F4B1D4
MQHEILTKQQLADRQQRSVESINTACSREPDSVPPFFKLGKGKNSPIRFRLSDVIEWEAKQAEKARAEAEAEMERRNQYKQF